MLFMFVSCPEGGPPLFIFEKPNPPACNYCRQTKRGQNRTPTPGLLLFPPPDLGRRAGPPEPGTYLIAAAVSTTTREIEPSPQGGLTFSQTLRSAGGRVWEVPEPPPQGGQTPQGGFSMEGCPPSQGASSTRGCPQRKSSAGWCPPTGEQISIPSAKKTHVGRG